MCARGGGAQSVGWEGRTKGRRKPYLQELLILCPGIVLRDQPELARDQQAQLVVAQGGEGAAEDLRGEGRRGECG